MTRRLRIVAFLLTSALLLLTAGPAAAHTTPLPGETLPALVKRTCGTSAGWQDQAARNGIATTGPRAYWVYLGRSYDIRCGPSGTSATPSSSQGWRTPVDLSSCFRPNGSREFGTNRGDHRHGGLDLGAPVGVYAGEPVYAAAAGRIIAAGYSGNAGYRIRIDHGGGIVTAYHHLRSFARTSGTVRAGEVIGFVGISGNATAFHLHWEVIRSGVRVDPIPFMRDRGVRFACS